MGAKKSVVNRLGSVRRPLRRLGVGAVIVGALVWCVAASAGTGSAPTITYNVVLGYSGTLQYTNDSSDYHDDVSLKFSVSQPVEVKFPVAGIGAGGAGTAEFKDTAPASYTASGSVMSTSSDPSSPDSCTISANNTKSVILLNVESGSVDNGKDTLDVQAAMPLTVNEQGTPGAVLLSGDNDNCADHYAGLPSSSDPQMESAESAMLENIDVSKLPYSKSFNVQSPVAGGQLSISTKFTITGLCRTDSEAVAASGSTYQSRMCQTYVALGDSYASGEGIPPLGYCHQSPSAYPQLVQNTLDFKKFYFEACTGATVAHLNQQVILAYQRHELSETTGLVTITIGGDDIGFVRLITDCVLARVQRSVNPNAKGCFQGKYGVHNVAVARAGLKYISRNLPDLLAKVHKYAPNAQVLVVGYPYVFPASSTIDCSKLHVFDVPLFGHPAFNRSDVSVIHDIIRTLNSTLSATVRAVDLPEVSFLTTTEAFLGHDACEPKESWFTDIYVNGTKETWSLHPTKDGQAALASRVIHTVVS